MTKISIIIPYYKKKKFFKKTINSIFLQTYKKFEVIIIYDDENLDELQLVKKLTKKDKRFKIIINKKNIGPGYSRNKGIKFSTGDYICFLDADDIWRTNKLQFQLNYMKKNNYLITHTSYSIINKNNKIISTRFAKSFGTYNDLLFSCDIGLSTVMIKKEIFKNKIYFPKTRTKEDFILWLNILKKNIKIFGIKKNLSYWINDSQSLSSDTLQKLIDGFKVYRVYMGYSYLKSIIYLFFLSLNYLKKL